MGRADLARHPAAHLRRRANRDHDRQDLSRPRPTERLSLRGDARNCRACHGDDQLRGMDRICGVRSRLRGGRAILRRASPRDARRRAASVGVAPSSESSAGQERRPTEASRRVARLEELLSHQPTGAPGPGTADRPTLGICGKSGLDPRVRAIWGALRRSAEICSRSRCAIGALELRRAAGRVQRVELQRGGPAGPSTRARRRARPIWALTAARSRRAFAHDGAVSRLPSTAPRLRR